jgi:hypothetical protein
VTLLDALPAVIGLETQKDPPEGGGLYQARRCVLSMAIRGRVPLARGTAHLAALHEWFRLVAGRGFGG